MLPPPSVTSSLSATAGTHSREGVVERGEVGMWAGQCAERKAGQGWSGSR